MTYFTFLVLFILPPLALFTFLARRDERRGRLMPAALSNQPWLPVLLAHVVVAVIYTTPWDNYLVASGVWFYNPELVTGLVLGWVPIEEYTFFVLETLLAGLWLVWLLRRLPADPAPSSLSARAESGRRGVPGRALAVVRVGVGLARTQPGTYLALLLVWALPPILLQVGVGADILWSNRRAVLGTIVPLTLYLAVADSVAIGAGTWTIDPGQSFHLLLLGRLPVEELVFFLVTVVLVAFGMTLVMSTAAQARVQPWFDRLRRQQGGPRKWITERQAE